MAGLSACALFAYFVDVSMWLWVSRPKTMINIDTIRINGYALDDIADDSLTPFGEDNVCLSLSSLGSKEATCVIQEDKLKGESNSIGYYSDDRSIDSLRFDNTEGIELTIAGQNLTIPVYKSDIEALLGKTSARCSSSNEQCSAWYWHSSDGTQATFMYQKKNGTYLLEGVHLIRIRK